MDAIRLHVRAIVLEGSSVYSPADLDPYFQPYAGREASLRQLYDLADAITARYQEDGYIISQVVIPDQVVADGVVRLEAIEGYVAEVRIGGDLPEDRDVIEAYASAIAGSRPLQAQVLERYLLLLNDLPGVLASATLASLGEQSGAAELAVQVSRARFGAALGINNLGSRSLGPWRLSADVDAIGILRAFDYSALRIVSTGNRELNYASLFHEQLIGSDGLKANVFVSGVEAEPGASRIVNTRLETRSRAAGLGVSYPLLRTRSRNLYLKAALTAHDGETEVTGFRPTEDRLRALRLGASFDAVDALRGVNAVDLELSQGLRVFGASANDAPELSRAAGRVDFTKLVLYAARLQSLGGPWSLLAALSAQYGLTDLLVSEQFAIGGEQFGRGYDAAELIGDSGAALKLEVRYAGGAAATLPGPYTLYAYYDVGAVWLRTPLAEIGETGRQSAASAGIGARLTLGERASAFIELAQPLTRDVAGEGNRHARLFGGVSVRF